MICDTSICLTHLTLPHYNAVMSDFFLNTGAPHVPVLMWNVKLLSEQEWLFCRLRSGFCSECYVTWYMGQNNSITYEIAVQTGVTVVKGRLMQTAAVSVFSGCGSVLITDRHAPESAKSFFFLPHFISPTPSVCILPFTHPRSAISYILFSQIPSCRHCHTLMLPLPHLVSLWQSARQPDR